MPKAPAVKWTREHFLIALNLYCKLPFGQLHKRNPIIKEIAEKMGRTANSLAMIDEPVADLSAWVGSSSCRQFYGLLCGPK